MFLSFSFHMIYLFETLFYLYLFIFFLLYFQSFASSPNLHSFLHFTLSFFFPFFFYFFLLFFHPFFNHLILFHFCLILLNLISSCFPPSYHIYLILVVVAAAAVVRVNFPFRPDSYAAFVELRMYVEYCILGALLLLPSLLRYMQSVASILICLSVCLSACLPIYLSISLSVSLSVCMVDICRKRFLLNQN